MKSLVAQPECKECLNGSKVSCPCNEITTRHAPCIDPGTLRDHQTDKHEGICTGLTVLGAVPGAVRIARSYSYVTIQIARRSTKIFVRDRTNSHCLNNLRALKALQMSGHIKRWDRSQLDPTCTRRISLLLTAPPRTHVVNNKDILLVVGLIHTYINTSL